MNEAVNDTPPELLRKALSELINECKQRILNGDADAEEIGKGVRMYCETVAALPKDEAKKHGKDLESLMEEISGLSKEMVHARDMMKDELEELSRFKSARAAYQKSDAIAGPRKPQEEE